MDRQTNGELIMQNVTFNRRQMMLGTGVSLAGLALTGTAVAASLAQAVASSTALTADQVRRMQWWHAAKFGMFIHFGVYSTIGRHEWAMEDEAIPVVEYAPHAAAFNPVKNSARAGAKLANAAGMNYM